MRRVMVCISTLTLSACGGAQEAPVLPGVIAFVHGGGWVSAPTVTPPNATGLQQLARDHGFAYVELKYPLATRDTPSYPAAHRAVRDQLVNLSVSYERVYVIGTSAGANLVALALLERPDAADRAALFYGVYDLPAMSDDFNVKYSNVYTYDLYTASPAHIGPLTTPHHLWHGVSDELVPYSQSVNYAPDSVTLVDGAGHAFNVTDYVRPYLFP